MMDSTRFLGHLHFSLSHHRRVIIQNNLKGMSKSNVGILMDSPIDDLLFGSDLTKKLKANQELVKISAELQDKTKTQGKKWGSTPSSSSTNNNNYNLPIIIFIILQAIHHTNEKPWATVFFPPSSSSSCSLLEELWRWNVKNEEERDSLQKNENEQISF